MRNFLSASVLLFACIASMAQNSARDSDRDGLSDELEQALLRQFAPQFMVADGDCSLLPAQFVAHQITPMAEADNGTIYGQAFPAPQGQVELHYYHLWRTDCGQMGHPLDAEHVSALVAPEHGSWTALYWYAAAHEDTVCDASQITRASTLNAESRGPQVWISRGKHASFLGETLCTRGCGGDRCADMKPMATAQLVNIGELKAPMNGTVWSASTAWPLADKLRRSDFTKARIARLDRLPATDIASANPEKRPMQAVIGKGKGAAAGGATGFRATNTALVIADTHTSNAVDGAAGSTGQALKESYRAVLKALGLAGPKDPQPK